MLLDFFKKKLNDRLTRELWVKVYVETMNEGHGSDFAKSSADNSVVAYNNKFVKVKIKLN